MNPGEGPPEHYNHFTIIRGPKGLSMGARSDGGRARFDDLGQRLHHRRVGEDVLAAGMPSRLPAAEPLPPKPKPKPKPAASSQSDQVRFCLEAEDNVNVAPVNHFTFAADRVPTGKADGGRRRFEAVAAAPAHDPIDQEHRRVSRRNPLPPEPRRLASASSRRAPPASALVTNVGRALNHGIQQPPSPGDVCRRRSPLPLERGVFKVR